jgi:hypothetical protein
MYDSGGWIDDADMEGSGGSLLSVRTVDYLGISKVLGHAVYPEHLTHARPIKNRAPQNTILSQRKIEISSFSVPNVLDNRYLNFELLSKFFG